MNFHIFWADSRGKVVIVLAVLTIAAIFFIPRVDFFVHIVLAACINVFFDSFLVWYRTKRIVFPLSGLVTGFLIGLVFDPTGSLLPMIIACLIASLSKEFFGSGQHTHIFNPAALGIVISSFLFSKPVAWWGAAWGTVPVFIIGVSMACILWKLHRIFMPITFLAVYFLSMLTKSSMDSALRLTFDGTVMLFAFIMLPEPKTAPVRGLWRYAWGLLVGGLVYIQSVLKISFIDPLLIALLAANGIGYVLIRSKKRSG